MTKRIALVLLFTLVVSGSAWGHGVSDRKHAIDEKIALLRDKIAAADKRESVLTSEISAVTARIRGLQDDVAAASSRLDRLEGELAVYEERLRRLTALYAAQTEKLELLREQHRIAQRRLNERLVSIYETEDPNALEVVLSARTFGDLLDQLDYLNHLGGLDKRIAGQVARAKEQMRRARAETARTRAAVERTTEAIRVRTEQQRAETNRLIASRAALAGARRDKQETLAAVQATEEEFLHEVEGLEQASAQLAARIQAAQRAASTVEAPSPSAPGGGAPLASAPSAPSSSGFIWPVSGPVTSSFGWRWGRMHEGIDISAPSGTPIRAAANGSVIYAGWMSGYGNLVVVDHGGGVASAYAHMSSIGAGVGQAVVQGQVIGYVGCTGHCYGDHLHFEVRVNGAAVDPLGYL